MPQDLPEKIQTLIRQLDAIDPKYFARLNSLQMSQYQSARSWGVYHAHSSIRDGMAGAACLTKTTAILVKMAREDLGP